MTYAPAQKASAGLTSSELTDRRAQYGFNELGERKRHPLLEFMKRYWGPMPWLLEAATALSVLLGHELEAIIISLRLGEVAPADCALVSGAVSVDQSALTGESLPVDIGPGGTLYSSSPVKGGKAICRVEKIGKKTYIGHTARLMESARPKSHQEEVMLEIVKYMMDVDIVASALVAIYALILKIDPFVVLTFVVIFLMGAVPVALPAVLSIVQSVGAMELSLSGALVTRLEAIEDAASIDVLCFDKTGTLTRNMVDTSTWPKGPSRPSSSSVSIRATTHGRMPLV